MKESLAIIIKKAQERHEFVYKLHKQGLSYKEIGKIIGRSKQRVHQMVAKCKRLLNENNL